MKKSALILAVVSSVVLADEPIIAADQEKLKLDIAKAKADKKSAEAQIKKLESQLASDDTLVTRTELGYIKTTGNTKTETFNLELRAKKGWGKHITNLSFDGQYANDKGVETKNKFLTEITYDYEFTKRFAFNYLAGYKQDKFSGFKNQWYTGPGAKYKAIITPKHKLTFDGNLLYSSDKYNATTKPPPPISGYTNEYMGYRAKLVYNWQVLDNLKFDEEVSFRGSFKDENNYFVYSKSAFTSKISNIFSAGMSYKVDYVNEPALGKKTTDTTITANLIMDY